MNYQPKSKVNAYKMLIDAFKSALVTVKNSAQYILMMYINHEGLDRTSSPVKMNYVAVDPILNQESIEDFTTIQKYNSEIMATQPLFEAITSQYCALCGKQASTFINCLGNHFLCDICAIRSVLSTNAFIGNFSIWTKKCPLPNCCEFISLQGSKEIEKAILKYSIDETLLNNWNRAAFNNIYCSSCESTAIFSHNLDDVTKHHLCIKCLKYYAKAKHPANPYNLSRFNTKGEPTYGSVDCPIPECGRSFMLSELKSKLGEAYILKHSNKMLLKNPDLITSALNIIV